MMADVTSDNVSPGTAGKPGDRSPAPAAGPAATAGGPAAGSSAHGPSGNAPAVAPGKIPVGAVAEAPDRRPGFIRRHRLPLTLGVIAVCLYVGSIVYILYGRGQIA